MKHRKLVSALTLMAFVGCMMAVPMDALAQSWSNRSGGYDNGMNLWNRSWGNNSSFSQGGGIANMLKRVIPGLLGGVAGFFLGSQFGMIGKIVGSAAGFFLASWLANKLFPANRDRYSYNDYSRDYHLGWNNQGSQNYGAGWGPWRGSETGAATGGDGNLTALRDRYFQTTQDYQSSLRGSDTNAQDAARRSFEAARSAYFDAIKTQYR